MVRLDWHKNSIKLLSILLAFILWVYVSNEQNPLGEKVLNINLEYTGLAPNFLIAGGMPENIRVRVLGNKNQLAGLTQGDFKAVINIPEGKTGEIALPVQLSVPPGLRVAQVDPEEVIISVDIVVEKEIPVIVSLHGTPAQGYTALAPVCRPGTVTARGPGKIVNGINHASAVVDITSAVKDIEQTVPVSTGIAGISLSPSVTRVVVPVALAELSKTIPVRSQVVGTPAAGFTVKRSYSEPETVQVFGAVEALSTIVDLKTEPVDISAIDKNLVKEVGLVLVPGITGVQPGRVKVYVEVDKIEARSQHQNSSGAAPKES